MMFDKSQEKDELIFLGSEYIIVRLKGEKLLRLLKIVRDET